MEKQVLLRDVALKANVSVSTVSLVLNNSPKISRATQNKVLRIVEEMGYQPNRAAQSLVSRIANTLAILMPPVRNALSEPYFGELLNGICDQAEKCGFKILIEHAKPAFIRERKHLQLFERRYVDGMLCLGISDKHTHLNDFAERRFPVITVDNFIETVRLDRVYCDYAGGAHQLMRYLLQLGHRKIALIHGSPQITTARMVMDVYKQKLSDYGIPFEQSLCEFGKYTETEGAHAFENVFKRHPDLTAVFAGNDKVAIGAVHCCNHNGIKVPQQVSIVGFDDLPHSAFVFPSLTTVHLPLYQLGSLACERLIERIRGRKDEIDERLPTHLVVRESTTNAPTLVRVDSLNNGS